MTEYPKPYTRHLVEYLEDTKDRAISYFDKAGLDTTLIREYHIIILAALSSYDPNQESQTHQDKQL